jgi:hypothetical protein
MNDKQLDIVQKNQDLLKLYSDSALLGSQNLQGAIPMLKVHTSNKSIGNELSNGKEPNDGWFFLSGMGEQFEAPICHILSISRGFKAEGMVDKKTNEKGPEKFNQILAGVIVDGTDYKPFLMYFTGIKLSRLWDFGKEVSKYVHAKPIAIPMFALTVKLTTEKVKHEYGSSYAVNFEIVKEGDFPRLVTDPGQFVFLRDSLVSVEATINSLIDLKSTEDKVSTPSADRDSQGNVIEDIIVPDDFSTDKKEDMPF